MTGPAGLIRRASEAGEILNAADLLACAFGARCQPSDLELHPEGRPHAVGGWLRLLRERRSQAL